MATRNYGGFGDGLARGFGLVNDFYAGQRKNELDQQRLDMERNYREGILSSNERELDLKGRQLDIDDTKAQADLITAKTKADQESSVNRYRDEQADALEQTTRFAKEDREKRQNAGTRRDQSIQNFTAAQRVFNYWQASQLDRTKYDPKEMARLLQEVGGMAEFAQHINPITMQNIESFQTGLADLAAGGEAGEEIMIDMLATVFAKNRDQYGIGSTVTAEQNPAAPEWARGMTIVGKVPTSAKYNAGRNTVSATIDVQVQDSSGRTYIYEAPMTDGGDGSGISPTSETDVQDLFSLAGGFITYNRAAQPLKAAIKEAQVKTDKAFLDENNEYDSTKYSAWMNQSKTAYMRSIQGKEDQPSLIKGVTKGELASNSVLLEDYLHASRYDPDSFSRAKQNSPGDRITSEIRGLDELTGVERQLEGMGLPPLSRSQLLELQPILRKVPTEDGKGKLEILDKKAFNAWRRRVTELENTPALTGTAGSGVGGYDSRMQFARQSGYGIPD